MAEPFDTTLASNPQLDDTEPHVCGELLASHELALTAERATLEAEDVSAEDSDLLVIRVVTPLAWG